MLDLHTEYHGLEASCAGAHSSSRWRRAFDHCPQPLMGHGESADAVPFLLAFRIFISRARCFGIGWCGAVLTLAITHSTRSTRAIESGAAFKGCMSQTLEEATRALSYSPRRSRPHGSRFHSSLLNLPRYYLSDAKNSPATFQFSHRSEACRRESPKGPCLASHNSGQAQWSFS